MKASTTLRRAAAGLLAAAAISTVAGVSAVAPASAATAAPAASCNGNGWAWFYTGTYYTGTAQGIYCNNKGGEQIQPANSVINYSGNGVCGSNYNYPEVNYYFWNGGAWGTVGAPFTNLPLTFIYWC
jgi:hypothetical protein